MDNLREVERRSRMAPDDTRRFEEWLHEIDNKVDAWGTAPDPVVGPAVVVPHGCHITSTSDGIPLALFWSTASPFSNFYPIKITINGREWPLTETFFMHHKAVAFGDSSAAASILEHADDPKRVKALGRGVEGFDPSIWRDEGDRAMLLANYRKYQQSPGLRGALLATGEAVLVEASPFDRIWGIGMGEGDGRARDPARWKGENRLGRMLTLIREHLKGRDAYRGQLPAHSQR